MRRAKWGVGSVVSLMLALAPSAYAAPPTSQVQVWHVGRPSCQITHAWQKQPATLTSRTVALTGAMSCASLPPNLTISGSLQVSDLTANPNAPTLVDMHAGGDATSPSFSMTPTLTGLKTGHQYLSELTVSFVDSVDFSVSVSGAPPQCAFSHSPNPFPSGPFPDQTASLTCVFAEEFSIL